LDCSEEEIEKLRNQAKWYTPAELEFAVELIADTGTKIRYALSKQVLLEILFIKLSRLKTIISIDQALLKLEELAQQGIQVETSVETQEKVPSHKQQISKKSQVASSSPETPVSGPSEKTAQPTAIPEESKQEQTPIKQVPEKIDFSLIINSWEKICDSCPNPLLHSYLVDKTVPMEYTDNTLFLGVPEELFFRLLNEKTMEIEQLLHKFFNAKISVRIKKHTGEKPKKDEAPKNGSTEKLTDTQKENEILNDSKVQMMIDSFDAKVISLRRNK